MTATTHREVERKYEAGPTIKLPRWSQLLGDIEPASQDQVLLATYVDTADLRLAKARITLRYRTGDDVAGWQLKLPAGKDTRDEIQAHDAGGDADDLPGHPPAELAGLLRAFTRGEPLRPIATVRTARRLLRWSDAAGRDLLEVTEDWVTARLLPSGPESTWREIELELGPDGDARLFTRADEFIRSAGIRRSAAGSKLARALGDRARQGRPSCVAGRDRAGGVVPVAYLRTQVAAIRRYDVEVRRDTEDSVHQLRIASRRARSVLQTYGRLIDREATRTLTTELAWLASSAAPARDLEVVSARILAAVEAEPAADVQGPVRERLAAWFASGQERARAQLMSVLDSERYAALLDSLDAVLADPPLTKRGGRQAEENLPVELGRAFRRVRAHMRAAELAQDCAARDLELHEARKAAKRLRYAAEAARPVLGKRASRIVRRTKVLQEVLGERQDAVLAAATLREIAAAADEAGESTFTYGVLYGKEMAARAEADAIAAAWTEVSKALRSMLKA